MVRFGSELFYARVPEWADFYVDYDGLVSRLEQLSEVVALNLRARGLEFQQVHNPRPHRIPAHDRF
jgi:hypothetical protein